MMVTGCVGPQAQVGASMPVPSADGRIIVDSMPNLVSIPIGHFENALGYVTAAYVIDRAANLCFFWTAQFSLSTSGILIDCCRLRKIPAAMAVLQTMSESCDGTATPAAPAPSAPAGN